MEDPWSNAWSESEQPAFKEAPKHVPWALSSPSTGGLESHEEVDEEVHHDEETTSWSTPETSWPSEAPTYWADTSHVSPLDGWRSTAQSHSDIPEHIPDEVYSAPVLYSASNIEEGVEEDEIVAESPTEITTESGVASPRSEVEAVGTSTFEDSIPVPSIPNEQSMPVTSDPFGTFEAEISPHIPTEEHSDHEDAWPNSFQAAESPVEEGQAWDDVDDVWTSQADEDGEKNEGDQWAIAREEKQKRDRRVPPEVLAAILQCWTELSSELYPPDDSRKDDAEGHGWMRELELSSAAKQLMPRRPSQPPIHFGKTQVVKSMASSMKLNRNLPIVKLSPMSQLFAAKGSSAWELSVKNRIDLPHDDTPAGWKKLESQATDETKAEAPEKKGIFSFWGKRTSTAPSVRSSVSRSSISKDGMTSPPARASSESNVNSSVVESRTGSSIGTKMTNPSVDSLRPSSISSFAAMESIGPRSSLDVSRVASPAPSTSGDQVVTTKTDGEITPVTSPPSSAAPSAVSRFFTRFSRTSSTLGSRTSSPHSSIALSSDEVDFLSDLVPSAHDDADEDDLFAGFIGSSASPSLSQSNSPSIVPKLSAPPIPALPPPTSAAPSSSRSSTPSILSGNKVFDTKTWAIPPPPSIPASSSRSHTPPVLLNRISQQSKVSTSFAKLSPPIPIVLSPPPLPAGKIVQAAGLLDDDEFSSFQSSTIPHSLSAGNKSVMDDSFEFPSSHSLMPHGDTDTDTSFGDFADFRTDTLRTPSPPRPPRKSLPSTVPPAPAPLASSSVAARRSSRAANHLSTVSLLEKAAARPGRWPAPPSPHINPLAPPPPPSTMVGQTNGDFFDSIESSPPPAGKLRQRQPSSGLSDQMDFLRPSSSYSRLSSASTKPILNPSPSLQPSFNFAPSFPTSISKPTPSQSQPSMGSSSMAMKPASNVKGGALSAQDLSFFEGL